MLRQKIKEIIYKYNSNLLSYFFILKGFKLDLFSVVQKLIYNFTRLFLSKKVKRFNSDNISYQDVIEITFRECYSVLQSCNIIFFQEINKGSYRFIILDKDIESLSSSLKMLLKKGYIVEFITPQGEYKFIYKDTSIKKYIDNSSLIRVYKLYYNTNNIEEFGSEIAFEIEYWYKKQDYYITKSKNGIQNKISSESLQNTIKVDIFNHTVLQIYELYIYDKYKKRDSVDYIDIVYTWVDGFDTKWSKKKDFYAKKSKENIHSSSVSSSRFENWDELKYSLRSLEKYFIGYRKIFLVVDSQKPSWLKESNNLIIVDHKELFPDDKVLPVFNSHAIETVLHRIDGLSEHYLYINDDIFFGKATDISLFFPKKNMISIFPSTSTFIPFEKIDKKLLPVDTASINSRKLLLEKNIGFAQYKFKHTPLPQLKTILFELEKIFQDKVLSTRESRFRHPYDISMTSSLLHNFAYLRDIAKEKNIDYSYINLGNSNSIFLLKRIISLLSYKRPNVFCINDIEESLDKNREEISLLMNRFLPTPSKYEQIKDIK